MLWLDDGGLAVRSGIVVGVPRRPRLSPELSAFAWRIHQDGHRAGWPTIDSPRLGLFIPASPVCWKHWLAYRTRMAAIGEPRSAYESRVAGMLADKLPSAVPSPVVAPPRPAPKPKPKAKRRPPTDGFTDSQRTAARWAAWRAEQAASRA